MKNLKFILGFSIFGFALSFFFGLFSGAAFGRILLLAFIFALVFAVLGFAMQFLFQKVLNISDSYADSSPVSENASRPYSTGQNVDITIEDQDFPEGSDDSQFFVGTNHQMLNEEDMKGSAKASSSAIEGMPALEGSETDSFPGDAPEGGDAARKSEDSARQKILSANAESSSGFVPISFSETASNITGTESKTAREVGGGNMESLSDGSIGEGSSAEELDTLPDLEDITSAAPRPSGADDSYIPSGQSSGRDASEITEGRDVSLMAKAISTLLAKE